MKQISHMHAQMSYANQQARCQTGELVQSGGKKMLFCLGKAWRNGIFRVGKSIWAKQMNGTWLDGTSRVPGIQRYFFLCGCLCWIRHECYTLWRLISNNSGGLESEAPSEPSHDLHIERTFLSCFVSAFVFQCLFFSLFSEQKGPSEQKGKPCQERQALTL